MDPSFGCKDAQVRKKRRANKKTATRKNVKGKHSRVTQKTGEKQGANPLRPGKKTQETSL